MASTISSGQSLRKSDSLSSQKRLSLLLISLLSPCGELHVQDKRELLGKRLKSVIFLSPLLCFQRHSPPWKAWVPAYHMQTSSALPCNSWVHVNSCPFPAAKCSNPITFNPTMPLLMLEGKSIKKIHTLVT